MTSSGLAHSLDRLVCAALIHNCQLTQAACAELHYLGSTTMTMYTRLKLPLPLSQNKNRVPMSVSTQ